MTFRKVIGLAAFASFVIMIGYSASMCLQHEPGGGVSLEKLRQVHAAGLSKCVNGPLIGVPCPSANNCKTQPPDAGYFGNKCDAGATTCVGNDKGPNNDSCFPANACCVFQGVPQEGCNNKYNGNCKTNTVLPGITILGVTTPGYQSCQCQSTAPINPPELYGLRKVCKTVPNP
jgi:hypothetical protein